MTVGVTGGMGAGKTCVSRVFEAEGALVVDADRVGHETVTSPEVLQELVAAFGPDILDGKGRLVRRTLARRAFAPDASRQRLNAIVWPALEVRLRQRVQEALHERPGRPVVIDAPLLLEWGRSEGLYEVLVVVTAPVETRIERTVSRLGISRAEAEVRMASQLPDEEKVRVADYVIVPSSLPD